MNFERLTHYKYRIPREGKMEVDAAFYASEKILDDLEAEDYASLGQLQNVATLPGIVEPALTMPDIHWGYGFPIGGVAAFDPRAGGVVSPGGVGFDINCGVRLLTSEIGRGELERRKDRLADALFEAVPSGVGRGRSDLRMSRGEIERVLVEGCAPLVEWVLGEAEDLGRIESGGRLAGADPGRVSRRAFERGLPQLGTLGSGNHFLEVQ